MRSNTLSALKKISSSFRVFFLLLGGLYLLSFVVLSLWHVPPYQVEQVRGRLDRPVDEYRLAKLEDEYRRTLAQSIGGLFLLVGLYLGWRRVRVAEEGHITERFTRAIEQLGQKGDGNMAIRLGGIYALERIAKDSEKDHGPIMEILTAYVRENAPRQEAPRQEEAERPPTDIQAILTVIGRRKATAIRRFDDILDLTYTHLTRARLMDANLTVTNLREADLTRANLTGANLDEALLRGADLTGAYLREADLNKADLREADLTRAKHLTAAQVQSARSCYGATLPDYLPDSVKNLTKRPPLD